MPFSIVRQDITKMKVDAIVNASNTHLVRGDGVSGAIFEAAGEDELQAACDALAPIYCGEAVTTPAFNLPCKYIIHVAGPIFHPLHRAHCELLLRDCYVSALEQALLHNCTSIAFPLISSGIYGYPKEEALLVATSTIKDYLNENEMTVFLTVFDSASFALSRTLFGEVQSYIEENLEYNGRLSMKSRRPDMERDGLFTHAASREIKDFDTLDETFPVMLNRLIYESGKSPAEVYKGANIDRKLFSKICTAKNYTPRKATVLAFAISLRLDLAATDKLLKSAGYALSHSQKFDVIIEYFIVHKQYDIFEINEVLFGYDQQLLGS